MYAAAEVKSHVKIIELFSAPQLFNLSPGLLFHLVANSLPLFRVKLPDMERNQGLGLGFRG